MLGQLNRWIEIASTAVDVLLLLRVLQLKLHRVYVFITLSCVLSVFFDGLMLWFHADSAEFGRIFLYSRFLYAFVLPAAAYDVWEEIKPQIVRIRRFAVFRLASSLILAGILGLIIVGFAGNEDSGSDTAGSHLRDYRLGGFLNGQPRLPLVRSPSLAGSEGHVTFQHFGLASLFSAFPRGRSAGLFLRYPPPGARCFRKYGGRCCARNLRNRDCALVRLEAPGIGFCLGNPKCGPRLKWKARRSGVAAPIFFKTEPIQPNESCDSVRRPWYPHARRDRISSQTFG